MYITKRILQIKHFAIAFIKSTCNFFHNVIENYHLLPLSYFFIDFYENFALEDNSSVKKENNNNPWVQSEIKIAYLVWVYYEDWSYIERKYSTVTFHFVGFMMFPHTITILLREMD